ncbi:MAG: hypothetical protein KDH84_00975, partial [Calditrichaeota bacterium]|nr:hypothetical protein [Calditrichota bacterium]
FSATLAPINPAHPVTKYCFMHIPSIAKHQLSIAKLNRQFIEYFPPGQVLRQKSHTGFSNIRRRP